MTDAPEPLTEKHAAASVAIAGALFLASIAVYGLVAHFIAKDIGGKIDSKFTTDQVQWAFMIDCGVTILFSWCVHAVLVLIASKHARVEERPTAFARAAVLGMGIATTAALFGVVAFLLTTEKTLLIVSCAVAAALVFSHLVVGLWILRDNRAGAES